MFYDAAREGVDAKQEAVQWAQDRHHFRLIVSPERGGDIPDMTAYVREVMRRVERDLDTKLQWIAVNHHNTDNPHAHILLRGKQADGADLVIPRQYISYGIRDRASEVATELLGERTPQEVQLAKSKEVEAERFTSLDRMIERAVDNGKIDVSPSKHIGFGADDRRLVVGRLQFLEQMDLCTRDGERLGMSRGISSRPCANSVIATTSFTSSTASWGMSRDEFYRWLAASNPHHRSPVWSSPEAAPMNLGRTSLW